MWHGWREWRRWRWVPPVAVVTVLLAGCRVAGAGLVGRAAALPAATAADSQTEWVQRAAAVADQPQRLFLRWAAIDYADYADYVLEPSAGREAGEVSGALTATEAGGMLELRVILDNREAAPTESTTIAWGPPFTESCAFVGSDPAPWRVRVDPDGWGVLDTAGVLPEQFGTFRLWFAGAGCDGLVSPRVAVVADGRRWVGEALAGNDDAPPARAAAQRLFERSALVELLDALPSLPTDSRGAFQWAAVLSAAMGLMALGGCAAAYGASRR